MTNFLDNYYAYKFVYILTRPWEEQDAFKYGLIDKNGNRVKSVKATTPEAKHSINKFHVLVFNLKKVMEKLPMGKSTLATYLAALRLLKDHVEGRISNPNILLSEFVHLPQVAENTDFVLDMLCESKYLVELEGSTAGIGGGSVTTGVDNMDMVLGTGKPNKKKKKVPTLWGDGD